MSSALPLSNLTLPFFYKAAPLLCSSRRWTRIWTIPLLPDKVQKLTMTRWSLERSAFPLFPSLPLVSQQSPNEVIVCLFISVNLSIPNNHFFSSPISPILISSVLNDGLSALRPRLFRYLSPPPPFQYGGRGFWHDLRRLAGFQSFFPLPRFSPPFPVLPSVANCHSFFFGLPASFQPLVSFFRFT